jgi:uncharacterized protein (TIRG00374 family)
MAVVAQCLCYLAHSYALGAILGLFQVRLSLPVRIGLAMAPYSLSLVWGGQLTSTAASYRWMRRAGVHAETAIVAGVMPALVNLLSVLGVATFGIGFLLAHRQVSEVVIITLLVPLAIVALTGAVVAWIVGHRTLLVGLAHRSAAFWARLRRRPYDAAATDTVLESLFDAWQVLLAGAWIKALAADLASVVFDLLTLFCVFLAAGYQIEPGLLVAGYGAPILAGKLSILPGGVGVIEGGMAALYAALGVPGPVVVVTVLGYRLLSFWIPVIIGFALAVWLDQTLAPEELAGRD